MHVIDCEKSTDSISGRLGSDPDPEVVEKVATLGFMKAYTEQCVLNNRHNLCNTTYHLLLHRVSINARHTHEHAGP